MKERNRLYIIKGMKHLEGVFLERKFDSDILCTIPKKPKSAFFSIEKTVFLPMQLKSKKGHFELTEQELVMVIKYMNCRIKHNFDKHHICSLYLCSKFTISFTDLLCSSSFTSLFQKQPFRFQYFLTWVCFSSVQPPFRILFIRGC